MKIKLGRFSIHIKTELKGKTIIRYNINICIKYETNKFIQWKDNLKKLKEIKK